MTKIGVIVCSNGLGHIVRACHVIARLLDRVGKLTALVVCEADKLGCLSGWPLVAQLRADPRVQFAHVESYPHWAIVGAQNVDEVLHPWHEDLQRLDLAACDLVLSDNLVEPLVHHPRAVLVGSFLWHDIYVSRFPHDEGAQEYARRCEQTLSTRRPRMIANRYFAMPAVRAQTQIAETGMFPALLPPRAAADNGEGFGILFAGPDRSAIDALFEQVLDAAGSNGHAPRRLYVDHRLSPQISSRHPIAVFNRDRDDSARIHAVVSRPGLGTITDCIVTGRPLFCWHEPNAEMAHNTATLERLGLGWGVRSPQSCLGDIDDFLNDPAARAKYDSAHQAIDRGGLEQAVDHILHSLNS